MYTIEETIEFLTSEHVIPLEEGLASAMGHAPLEAVHRMFADTASLVKGIHTNYDEAVKINNETIDFINHHKGVRLDHHNSLFANYVRIGSHWRAFIFLNDNTFNEMMKDIKNNQSISGVWVNTRLYARNHDIIRSASKSEDLIPLVKELQQRLDKLFNAIKASGSMSGNNKGLLGNIFVFAARDLSHLVKTIIRYSE